MSEPLTTLWGYPIVSSAAVPPETIVTVPMPTSDQLLEYGSLENYVEAMKRDFEALNVERIG